MSGDLDARIIAASAAGDKSALVGLYLQAARAAATEAERGFFLTCAWVFALETGDTREEELAQELEAAGRL